MTAPFPELVYYSSKSGNTHRFITRLGLSATKLPEEQDQFVNMTEPFVLVCPTYADGEGRGAVPKAVIRFLNNPDNRKFILGVIGTGNRNFGETYALSGRIIAEKCKVPLLYTFELAGTDTDIVRVRSGLETLGRSQCSTAA
ncbi:class Ib ribonucleoside-diphosphate reductase assembly flavoprotein NrdI [Cognatishimia activa]|uniref:Protein NrdI n=1 Tax=Cognatishimia activa TaxID=1715691 RepID=A0A0P1IXU0_9RHOB|nr:class Ib ribonucleoside-diphosphate reductase assembly flavoprotein NrdI [Cognatishimia activa]MEE2945422.1 class Ib ribonucleoside-diphosphate reductase assembly flavoprotein NrdI [Pseudomonadota bacterium]CUI97212.1 Putative NrdI-like protein [Cognatishimia activa]CUK25947.1 Putative NrdI-like protein [Cognatishimia activa]